MTVSAHRERGTAGAGAPDRPPTAGSTVLADRAPAAVVALIGFIAAAPIMTDNSLLTHLAVGDWILTNRAVPQVDVFSRLGAGEPWTVQSWLATVVYAVSDRIGGPTAVRLLHGVVGALIGVGLWRLTEPARRPWVRLVLASAPPVIGLWLWSPRPLLFGLAGLVAVLLVIRGSGPLWPLAPILWLWANAHGSFPLAGVLVVATLAGAWLDRRRLPERDLRALAWVGVGTVAGAIGPIGIDLLTFPVRVVATRGEALDSVVEWEAPSYETPGTLLWAVLVAGVVLVMARRALPWAVSLPVVLFLVSGLLTLRSILPASVVLVVLLAPHVAGPDRRPPTVGAVRSPTVGTRPVDGPAGRPGRLDRLLVGLGLASGAALVVGVVAVMVQPGLNLDAYPEAEVAALDRQGLLPVDDVVVVHREAVGNYLTWRYGDRARVFVDDRFDFHDLELLRDHRNLQAGVEPGEILGRRGADVVLWQADGALAAWLREADDWSVAADGDDWLIACRVGGAAGSRCDGLQAAVDAAADD